MAVIVSLRDLESGSISFETLDEAFGPSSLGILVVKDLPAEYERLRSALLSYASYLAAFPPEELESITDAASHYEIGWSHGKEKLRDDRYDTSKGSFYVNCNGFNPHLNDEDKRADEGHFHMAPNHWPSEELLPDFQQTFVQFCTLIINIGTLVAAAWDKYARTVVPKYEEGFFGEDADEPTELGHKQESPIDDSWCATHVGCGALTALTSAIYVDESSRLPPWTEGKLPNLPSAKPDPKVGLYIKSRTGEVVKVNIPESTLAFQTGLSLENVTEGLFKAVPHFVAAPRGGNGERVARNTLAIFMQPNVDEIIDKRSNVTFGKYANMIAEKHT